MVTCDQGIYYQQNQKNRKISLVVLTANSWKRIKEQLDEILAAINTSKPGSFHIVTIAQAATHSS